MLLVPTQIIYSSLLLVCFTMTAFDLMQKKGQMGMSTTTVAVIAAAITIVLGLVVIANINGSIDRDSFTADQNSTFDSVQNNVNSSLVLLGVGLIVLAAAAILIVVKILA